MYSSCNDSLGAKRDRIRRRLVAGTTLFLCLTWRVSREKQAGRWTKFARSTLQRQFLGTHVFATVKSYSRITRFRFVKKETFDRLVGSQTHEEYITAQVPWRNVALRSMSSIKTAGINRRYNATAIIQWQLPIASVVVALVSFYPEKPGCQQRQI